MFYYFGYGSNLNALGMRTKGVGTINTRPAALNNWRLAFNINHPYSFEGKVANVVRAAGETVHGALHLCPDEALEMLDDFEGINVYYDRLLLQVDAYDGESIDAYVYVGTRTMQGNEGNPSARYRQLLFDGGSKLGIEPHYLQWLASLETHPRPNFGPFDSSGAEGLFTRDEIVALSNHTILDGHVFDMSDAGPHQHTLLPMLEKRDVTQFFLQRMITEGSIDSAVVTERDPQSAAQNTYLNEYLHAFAYEYRYVGQLVESK